METMEVFRHTIPTLKLGSGTDHMKLNIFDNTKMENRFERVETTDYVLVVSDESFNEGLGIYFNEPDPSIEYLKNEGIDRIV